MKLPAVWAEHVWTCIVTTDEHYFIATDLEFGD